MRYRPRRGFTLIELLVAIALAVVLMSMVAAVLNSGAASSQRVISSSDRVSGWLLIARQRAIRDGAPRGVRFLFTPRPNVANAWECREAQYIETPDTWVPNRKQEANPSGPRIVFVYQNDPVTNDVIIKSMYYVSDIPADLATFDARSAELEYLVLPELNTSLKIARVLTPASPQFRVNTTDYDATQCREIVLSDANPTGGTSNPLNTWSNLTPYTVGNRVAIGGTGYVCILGHTGSKPPSAPWRLHDYPELGAAASNIPTGAPPPPPSPTLSTYKFAFQSKVQVAAGEPKLLFSSNTALDYRNAAPLTTNYVTYDITTKTIDMLFTPTGQVLNNTNGFVALWLRDTTIEGVDHPRKDATGVPNDAAGFAAAGQQSLIVVYTRTGAISTQPVSPTTDPWKNARDGINAGL